MTNATVPRTTRVVVVGGGVAGCSTAYHLAKRGWTDVVLIERRKLTSGTTWHAAGLITTARPTFGTREIVQRSLQVFQSLEQETGFSPGFERTGTLHLADDEARWAELRRAASAAHGNGIRAELVTPDEAVKLFPPLYAGDLLGAVHYPDDGRGNATDTTMALAAGARQLGVTILENTTVTGVGHEGNAVTGVSTTAGDIEAEYVVNTTGMWGREFGALAGVRVPLQALAHYYIVTEPIPGLPPGLPTIKTAPEYAYVKNEGAGLMVGFFEPGSYPWASRGIPADAEFTRLPEDWDHLGPYYETMIKRVPVLADAGIRLHFCGPESFTPDGLYHLGQPAGLRNYFVAAGFNSVGFLSGPGAGSVLADWIVDGYPSIDLPETDPRRSAPHEVNRRFLEQRVTETLDLAYEIHWPYQQRTSARGLRRSPLHDRVAAAGAVFGELLGWERANWYAPPGVPETYEYSFGRQNWFEHSAAEHRAVRESVAIFDTSSFGKLLVQGRDAEPVLQRVCANNVAVEPGRIVYTQWLNDRGGIEADVTVTRLAPDPIPGPVRAGHGRPRPGLAAAQHPGQRVRDGDRHRHVAGHDPGDGPGLPAAAPAAHRRRPVQCGVPVRHHPGDRPGLRLRPGYPDHLRRRARLGTAHPGRPGQPRLRHAHRGWRAARAAARRLPRAGLAAAGEGVPQLGTRHIRRRQSAGSWSWLRRSVG